MKSFNDNTGRKWDVSLSIATVKRVRNLVEVDLLAILDKPELLNTIATDPVLFVDVLYVIVKPQADAIGLTDEAFGELLNGESIEQATEAFLEALVDFFPGARQATLRRVLDRANAHRTKTDADLNRLLSDGTIDAAIDKALTDGATSTNSPAA